MAQAKRLILREERTFVTAVEGTVGNDFRLHEPAQARDESRQAHGR
jgi:hypothetical protein